MAGSCVTFLPTLFTPKTSYPLCSLPSKVIKSHHFLSYSSSSWVSLRNKTSSSNLIPLVASTSSSNQQVKESKVEETQAGVSDWEGGEIEGAEGEETGEDTAVQETGEYDFDVASEGLPELSAKAGEVQVSENSSSFDTSTVEGSEPKTESSEGGQLPKENVKTFGSSYNSAIDQDLKKVVQKTAATFAPRASTKSKNPAVPGTTLYTVFEVQAYASMVLGGVLSFNLLFPSNEPDLWRLMGMWSIWMFTIPSLRARDCSKNEKEALNYLFLVVPLLNVSIPFIWKSFSLVWSADVIAFFGMYAWKMGWLRKTDA